MVWQKCIEIEFTSPITRAFEGDHSRIPLRADSENFCVIRAILKCMEPVKGYKTWKFDKIKKQFNDLFGDSIRYGINAKQIEEWIKHYSIKANLYAISPDGKVCLQYIYRGNTHGNRKVIIPLLVNNNHANIIEDQEIINVLKTNKATNINNLINGNIRNLDGNAEFFTDYRHIELEDLRFDDDHFEGIIYINCTFPQLMGKLKSNIRQNCLCIDYNKEYVVNPFNGNVLCSVKYFELRKRACDTLFEKTGLFNFKFVNQSFATISKMIFWLANGCEYKTSSYNSAVMKALEYFPRPFNRTLRVVEENERGFRCGMDRASAYTTLILEHFTSKRIPVFTIYDDIKEFEGEFVGEEGMYLISKFYVKNVPFDTMLVSS